MTPYDAAMLGVVIAGMVWGAWRGITWQVASIASLVLGYLFAHPLSAQLAPHLPGEPVVARALAMLAVYAAVSGGVFSVAWLIRATLRKLRFEAFDRHLGMVLGGLEGAMLGLVGTLFVTSLAPSTRAPIFQSPTGRVVGRVMDAVGPVLPTEVRGAMASSWAHAPTVAKAEGPKEAGDGRLLKTTLLDFDRKGRGNGAREVEDAAPAEDAKAIAGEDDRPTDDPPPSFGELREKVGKAAGQLLERELGRGSAGPDDARARLGREAADLLQQGIKKGDTSGSGLKGLLKQGRSRLGRAAGQLLEREVEQRLGDPDGQDQDRTPRGR